MKLLLLAIITVVGCATSNQSAQAPKISPELKTSLSNSFTGAVSACDPKTIVRFAIDQQGNVSEFAVSSTDATEETKRCVAALKQQKFPSGSHVRGHFQIGVNRNGKSAEEKPTSGGLPQQAIKEVLDANLDAFRRCYEIPLQHEHDLRGELTLHFVIDAQGEVSRAFTVSNMGNAFVEWCVADKAILLTFPKPVGGGSVEVSYPVSFRPVGR